MMLRPQRILCVLFLSLFFFASFDDSVAAAVTNPPPVQVFYIPIPEKHIYDSFLAIFPNANNCGSGTAATAKPPIKSYVSIAINTDNTLIYYDQWEDGAYDSDIANPLNLYSSPGNPLGTQIWGDGNPANGSPPGYFNDLLHAGDIVILNSNINPGALDQNNLFDGRDKLGASKTVAMTRAGWASEPGTVLAGATEVYDTRQWGVLYNIPVAENMPAYGSNNQGDRDAFSHTAVSIMAQQTNTIVTLNGNNVGVLDEGESLFLTNGVRVNSTIETSHPVQAALLTGDICSTYESRWFTLVPAEIWSNSYITPVSSPENVSTSIFIHNPNSNAIKVEWETAVGAQTAFNVAAGQTIRKEVVSAASASGARFYTQNKPFIAISAFDSGANNSKSDTPRPHDWGFSLLPDDSLTSQVLVGWGPGRDPTDQTGSENYNPIWVTPICDTIIFADMNGDGQPDQIDLNGDGDTDDTNINGFDESTSQSGLMLGRLQAVQLYNPTGDQTGMLVYSENTQGGEGCAIAAAWGQTAEASEGLPAIDVGTTIPPLPDFEAAKGFELLVDANANGTVSKGDTIRYTVVIRNLSARLIPELLLFDSLAPFSNYVPNSTFVSDGLTAIPIPDSGITPFPLDEGLYNLGILAEKGELVISFEVAFDANMPDEITEISNIAEITVSDETIFAQVNVPLDNEPIVIEPTTIGDYIWLDLNQDGLQDLEEPGLAGVTVNLFTTAGVHVAATITDANGKYEFNDQNVLDGIQSQTAYEIRLDNELNYAVDGLLRNHFLTQQDVLTNSRDSEDSDGQYNAVGYPTIQFSPIANQANADYDIGLFVADCTADITYTISEDASQAFVTNNSTQNRYIVGLASYEKFNDKIDDQALYDFATAIVEPGAQNIALSVDIPLCAAQVDLFCGPVFSSLDGVRYGDRLLIARHNYGANYCVDNTPIEPDLGTIQGRIYAFEKPAAQILVKLIYAGKDNNFDGIVMQPKGGALFEIYSDDVVTQTYTDDTGKYIFTDLEVGNYLLSVQEGTLPDDVGHTRYLQIRKGSMEQDINFGVITTPTALSYSTIAASTSYRPSLMIILLLSLLAVGTYTRFSRQSD